MAARKAKAGARKRDSHPDEELTLLEKTLESGLPPIVVVRGEERWYRGRASRRVVEAAAARGDELCRHDAKDPEFSLSALLDDLTGGALFAETRCVVIENADALLKKGARLFAPGLVDAIVARLGSSNPGVVLVSADNLRADHKLVKAAKKVGGLVLGCRRLWDSPPPWDPDPRRTELARWVLDRAREREMRIGPDEAAYLVAATGNDLAGLVHRLDQLRAGGGEELRKQVGWESGGSPWELAERLVDGDAARSVLGVEALFRAGFQGRDGSKTRDPGALVTLLASAITARLREAVAGGAALAAGATPQAAAVAAGVKGGPRGQEAFRARLARRPPERWKGMLEEASDLERRSRSGAKIDAADFELLALRWGVRGGRRA